LVWTSTALTEILYGSVPSGKFLGKYLKLNYKFFLSGPEKYIVLYHPAIRYYMV
jgi:hypothetical protein